ncbi:MAG: hypothetical protein IKG51_01725 [Firmicutes bacterium]|nr:hypothetical protein [Bacillota bacterium]
MQKALVLLEFVRKIFVAACQELRTGTFAFCLPFGIAKIREILLVSGSQILELGGWAHPCRGDAIKKSKPFLSRTDHPHLLAW